MTARLSPKGEAFLKEKEELRLVAYRDQGVKGKWTIGWGHTKNVSPGQRITEADAEVYFRMDVAPAEDAINRLVKVPLTQNQFDALVAFAFNCGIEAFATSTLLKVLNHGDYALVPAQMMRWTKELDEATGQTHESQGLHNRRAAEVALWGSA